MKTFNEWSAEMNEILATVPPPDGTPLEQERRRQMTVRFRAIEKHINHSGPPPPDEWHLTVPDISEEEKQKLRDARVEGFFRQLKLDEEIGIAIFGEEWFKEVCGEEHDEDRA